MADNRCKHNGGSGILTGVLCVSLVSVMETFENDQQKPTVGDQQLQDTELTQMQENAETPVVLVGRCPSPQLTTQKQSH